MFMDDINEHRRAGMTDTQIAKGYGMSRKQLQASYSIARNEQRQLKIDQVHRMREKGMSYTAIGERLGMNESSVRALDRPGAKDKIDVVQSTANMLKREVDKKGAIDVGAQTEVDLPLDMNNPNARVGITRTKMDTALAMLKEEGYNVHRVGVRQLTGKGQTVTKVLAPPTKDPKKQWSDLVHNPDKIKPIQEKSDDGGRTWDGGVKAPQNISSKRIAVVYKEDGGAHKDGLIEIRPGVKDLDMGGSNYSQVRIAVDKSHFLKGMAVYNKDLPPGVDVRFHTNKSKADGKKGAMKEMEKGPDGKVDLLHPFGAEIKAGGQRGALNILHEEGDWDNFTRRLSSQMLSKQKPQLAKAQLAITAERSRKDLDEILSLTNPAVKRKLLQSYADSTDASAVFLHAASRVRQTTKVLIPVNSVKPNEIYSPGHRDGEYVALVRHPHGGTFEIPNLKVNNKNPEARKLLGNAVDAVGIHHKVAERLSGADFDGDYVVAIPNNRNEIRHTPGLKELEGFDPRASYPAYDGMRTIDGGRYNAKTKRVEYGPKGPSTQMQNEMGKVSNLITDMTLQGADSSEIARAVKHSMVIIDSEKHVLDHKASESLNGIPALKKKYQAGGASTLISRAKAPTFLPDRTPRPAKDGGPIDRRTGKKVFVETGKTKDDGSPVIRRHRTLEVTDDARRLVSKPGTEVERIYAAHSNRLKAMANEARKEYVRTQSQKQSKTARVVYKDQVESLESKLRVAQRNAPLEREAQRLGHSIARQRIQANPGLSDDDKQKIERRAIKEARNRLNSKKQPVNITQEEWNAIQAGAISNNKLEQILRHTEIEHVRKLALPRERAKMTSSKITRARQMLANGYTQAEVADALGVGLTTLKVGLSGE